MGFREWSNQVTAWLSRRGVLARYRPLEPLVVLRRAECEWATAQLTAKGREQLQTAAVSIKARFCEDTLFQVFVVVSNMGTSGRPPASARYLATLLPLAGEVREEQLPVSDFIETFSVAPGIVPVVVTIEPEVTRLLYAVYGTSDPDEVDTSIDLEVRFGEPHFFLVARARDVLLTKPPYRITIDTDE